jgi:hypothetical protein
MAAARAYRQQKLRRWHGRCAERLVRRSPSAKAAALGALSPTVDGRRANLKSASLARLISERRCSGMDRRRGLPWKSVAPGEPLGLSYAGLVRCMPVVPDVPADRGCESARNSGNGQGEDQR